MDDNPAQDQPEVTASPTPAETNSPPPPPEPVSDKPPLDLSSKSNLDFKPKDDACKGDGLCGKCVKGGLPLKKEILSFVTIVMISLSTILFVLWITALRDNRSVSSREPAPVETTNTKTPSISSATPPPKPMSQITSLPDPILKGRVSIEETLTQRRSRRDFSAVPVTQAELSQVLWAAQGITDENGHRAAPSARSLYPFTLYVVVRNVENLPAGLYQYLPDNHSLGNINLANAGELLSAAGVQPGAQNAPVVIVMAAAFGKMVESFPNNAAEVSYLEAGHIGQNIYLQVEGMEDLATVVMAGFNPKVVGDALNLDSSETVVYLVPLGHRGQPPAEAE